MLRKIHRFPDRDVTLLPGSEYADAQDAGAAYVLSLDPERLLAPYRQESGVSGEAKPYPNWESMGMGGHIGGHYLSALAGYWGITEGLEFLERAERMTRGLLECQTAGKNGYVGGIPQSRELFAELANGDIRAQSFDLNGSWVPLYNLHKLFAGLIDCWTAFAPQNSEQGDADLEMRRTPVMPDVVSRAQAVSERAKAIVLNLAHWWCELSDRVSDEAFQRMLTCEFGGMNESFAQLYELTGKQRYLEEAKRFTDAVFFDPLADGKDELTGFHANTQIPKVLGYERIAEIEDDSRYSNAVATFWNSVTGRRSVSIGAHSVAEHFHAVDDFGEMMSSRQGVETCNSYNMSKLAERLFMQTGESRYLDFYERVLENHLVSTIGVHEKGFVYFTPMRPQHYRVYSSAQECFWCCVGSGLENHARYGRLIYAYADRQNDDAQYGENELSVNLFMDSQLLWRSQGMTVVQRYAPRQGQCNEGMLSFTSEYAGEHLITVHIRRPWWCQKTEYAFEGCEGAVTMGTESHAEHDGYQVAKHTGPVRYDTVRLQWQGKGAARVIVRHCVAVSFEPLPDGSAWASVLRGPKVMAFRGDDMDLDGLVSDSSRAGHIASGPMRPMSGLPVISGSGEEVVAPQSRSDGTVDVRAVQRDLLAGAMKNRVLRLVPFSSIEASRYSVYLPWAKNGDVQSVMQNLQEIDAAESSEELLICDEVRCGEQQSEVDHQYQGEHDEQGHQGQIRYRKALSSGHFSYMLRDWERRGDSIRVRWMAGSGSVADADSERVGNEYKLFINDNLMRRTERVKENGVTVDRYAIERGNVGRGEEMASRIRIEAVDAATPLFISVAVMKSEA